MKRATLALLALAFIVGCASNTTAIENAKLAYVDSSIAYEAAMQTLSALRADHRITDAQWLEVDKAQKVVQALQPTLRASLDLWSSSGSKPFSYDGVVKQFSEAIAAITNILAEAKS